MKDLREELIKIMMDKHDIVIMEDEYEELADVILALLKEKGVVK